MRVLFVTSEAAPLVKTGGLADVSGALPAALRREGADVRLLLPGYPAVLAHVGPDAQVIAHLSTPPLPDARLLAGRMPDGVPLYVLDCPALYDRAGGPYQGPDGRDWPDNAHRFALFGHIAARLGHGSSPLDWRPDVLHCHDWQAGLAPVVLRLLLDGPRARIVMTIHNLAYQGVFPPEVLPQLALPWDVFRMEGVEYYGNLSFLKGGLQLADRLTTVSPTYAREIQREPLGFGLQGLLAWRTRDLAGILNGIDDAVWNPGADPLIARRYGPETLTRKDACKAALQAHFGLEPRKDVPLAGVVSRFAHQKGLDLLLEAAERALALPIQLAVLGSGEPALQDGLRALAARHPGRVGVQVGFDEALSHRIEAGADVFLMPSRFEPCGLNQMYSQRYGTPVVAHATGGLVDSITDATPETLADGTATGFLFREASPDALLAAIGRAVDLYANRRAWRRMQRAGMARDFSWDGAARHYLALYAALAGPG